MSQSRKTAFSRKLTHLFSLQSGISFHEAQVAMARIWIGHDGSGHHEEVVTLERPKDETGDPNQTGEKQKVSEPVKMPKTLEEVSFQSWMTEWRAKSLVSGCGNRTEVSGWC